MTDRSPVIFAGTPQLAADALESLHDNNVNVVAALTREDAPFGRKRIMTPSPVAQVAEKLGIRVIKANKVTPEVDVQIQETGAQLGVVVAYGALLKQHSLDALPYGWFNLHYSLLPAYRGAAPVQRALINAEEFTGISIFKLTVGLDTGPLVAQQKVPVPVGVNAGELLDRLTLVGAEMLPETIGKVFNGTAEFQEQQGEPSHATKLTKEDGLIDFSDTTALVAGRINGTSPSPGAWAYFQNKPIKFLNAIPVDPQPGLSEGQFDAVKEGIVVGTADGAILIKEVQPSGKRMMSAVDWARGVTTDRVFTSTTKEI